MQIKIKETKSYPTDRATIGGVQGWVLAAEGELVLIECKLTNEHTLIAKTIGSKSFHLYKSESNFPPSVVSNIQYYKPIIISKTEKIEVGDWFYDTYAGRNVLMKAFQADIDNPCNLKLCYKILALPEHYSLQQLQDIVDGKLKEGKVLIKCKEVKLRRKSDEFTSAERDMVANRIGYASEEMLNELCEITEHIIKLNPHITLHKVEEKMYTKEEVIALCVQYRKDWNNIPFDEEWFKNNVK